MLTGSSDEDILDWRDLRECQENEIALGHSLTAAEHALAREAVTLGLTFERAGIAFDPLTFITLRIVEGSSNEYVDPVACLDVLVLCHGGPIAEPEDAQYVLELTTGVVGFYGASSMERLPVETAITDNARRFKQLSFTPR